MSESVTPQTGVEGPSNGTGANPAAATPTNSNDPAPATVDPKNVQVPEGFELIKTDDKNALISARDKSNNSNKEFEANQSYLLRKDAVASAVADPEFKEKFPDVNAEDLMQAMPNNEEEIVEAAESMQKRFEIVRQNTLANIEVAEPPTISAEDYTKKMENLSGPNKPQNAFQQGIRLLRTKVKN